MGNVFISYRRDDTSGYARSLYQRLNERWPGEVFMDVDTIPIGRDFVEVINERIQLSDAVLVLIGPEWLSATDAAGRRRLDDTGDIVRIEVAHALKRKVNVIPVLVQRARMPAEAELPEDLRSLARRQAHELRDTRWTDDVARLEAALAPSASSRTRMIAVAAAAALVLITAVVLLLLGSGDDQPGGDENAPSAALARKEIPVGSSPKGVAVAGSAVWVINRGDRSVQQIDPFQKAVVGQPIDVGAAGEYIAADDRSVWVSVLGDGLSPGRVVRIDPKVGEVVDDRIRAGRFPLGLVLVDDALWVADFGGTVQRIDAQTGRPTDSIPLPGPARTLAAAAGKLWIPDEDAGVVRVIDIASRKLVSVAIPVGQAPTAVVAADGYVWVCDNRLDTVSRIDPKRMAVEGRPIRVGREPAEMAAGEGAVWVLNEGGQSVTRVDPRSTRAKGPPIKVGREPGGLAAGAGGVWVPNADDDTVTYLAPRG